MNRFCIWCCSLIVLLTLCASSGEADELAIPASKLPLRTAGGPWDKDGWNLWTVGKAGVWVDLRGAGPHRFHIVAAGSKADGVWPKMHVTITHRQGIVATIGFDELVEVTSTDPQEFSFSANVPPGTAMVSVTFPNDGLNDKNEEDRNLLLKQFRFENANLLDEAPVWWYPFGVDSNDLQRRTSAGILQHRMAKLTIETEPGAEVEVTQLRHAFEFGTALNSKFFKHDADREALPQYLRTVTENFNAAVHENALEWPVTDPQSITYDFEVAGHIYRWCHDHDITLRGHCIFWAIPDNVPDWVKALPDSALRDAIQDRAFTVTSYFRGTISEFDCNNEMLHGSYFVDRLGSGIRPKMFHWAKEGNPHAVLYLNDNGILSEGGALTGLYVRQIGELLNQQVPVGGIGCQGHFRGEVDPNHVRRTLDLLSKFELPIKITEYDYVAPNEDAKAQHLEQFFRVCFSHPRVQGIYQWGFWEGSHWRPAAALWTENWSPTPAADVYRRLVFGEWWTDFRGQANADGQCRVRVFHGTHQLRVNGRVVQELEIPAGTAVLRVRIGE